MTSLRNRRISALGGAMLLSLPVVSLAQYAPASLSEVIEVRVVNVEVVVEDSEGKRVTGLDAEQFRLLVDDREMPVEYFAEIRQGRTVDPAPAAPSPLPPAVTSGATVGNSLVVFIDDYFAIGAQRNLVLKYLGKNLGRLEPPNQAALVSFGGRRLELLTDLTSDRRKLEQAFDEAARRPAYGLSRFTERVRQGVESVPGELVESVRREFEGFSTSEMESELEREAAALVSTMQGFAGAPGRKVLLVLSGGWPSIDKNPFSTTWFFSQIENDLQILEPVIETANLLGFTLYPLDLPGIRTTDARVVRRGTDYDTGWQQAAGERSDREGSRLQHYNDLFIYGQPYDSFFGSKRTNVPLGAVSSEMLRQSTLRVVARETGGKVLLGSLRNQALPEVVDDTASYYWLGFTPQRAYDGETHRIRVQVGGGDYRLRTRRSYRDLSTQSQVSIATMGAALFGGVTGAGDVAVILGAPERTGYRKIEIPVSVEIPLDRVHFLPAESGYVADLELRLATVDEAGGQSEVPIIPVRLLLPAQPAVGETQRIETRVTLQRKSQDLVVSLFDPIGGEVFLGTAKVDP